MFASESHLTRFLDSVTGSVTRNIAQVYQTKETVTGFRVFNVPTATVLNVLPQRSIHRQQPFPTTPCIPSHRADNPTWSLLLQIPPELSPR